MPFFTRFFVLAACVAAGLAVPEARCDEAQLVKSQTIKTSGGSVSVNSFSCAPRVAKRQTSSSSSKIINQSGQICDNSCNDGAGSLPPTADDCNVIREAIRILADVDPTFALGGFGQQNMTFRTCTFFFQNNLPNEILSDWSDFGNDADQAASACFPPVTPLHSEGVCNGINGEWFVAAVHS